MNRRPLAAAALAALAVACGNPGFDRPVRPHGLAGEACTRLADCQSGLLCVSRRCAVALPAGACRPPATPVLAVGAMAGPAVKPPPLPNPPCALPVQPSLASGGTVQERGEHGVGEVISFDVPAGTAGFTIVSQEVAGSAVDSVSYRGGNLPNAVFPARIVQPGGGTFYDDAASPPAPGGYPDYTGWLAVYFGVIPSTGSMTVPNTSAALDLVRSDGQLPPGGWSFTLTDLARECVTTGGCSGGSSSGRYDVKVLTRPGGVVATGTLDLDVYLVSSDHPEYTAAAATGDPAASAVAAQFQRFVRGLSTIYARAGICLGTVTFHDVADWVRTELSAPNIDADGPCSDLSTLFRQAVPRDSVHLFLVDQLLTTTNGATTTVVGMDGSIPGPSGVPGGMNSGAAVVLADLGFAPAFDPAACAPDRGFRVGLCGTDSVAYIAAHEAGHWLGLYHTTEAGGVDFDPLSDTPTCPCGSCASPAQLPQCGGAGVQLSAPSCASGDTCAGSRNLMFWLIDPAYAAGELSPQQGEVMRLNPAVH